MCTGLYCLKIYFGTKKTAEVVLIALFKISSAPENSACQKHTLLQRVKLDPLCHKLPCENGQSF